MLAFLGLVFLLTSVVEFPGGSCSKFHTRDSNIDEANNYLDRIIQETVDENRHKLEPYHPKPTNFSFEHKRFLVTIRGEVSLHDIVVTGLTTIHREGDCKRSTQNGISKLSANLGMGILEFESKATIKFMNIGPTVTLSGEIGYALIHLEASRDVEAGTQPVIDKLEIYDLRGMKLKVSGLGLSIINAIASKIVEGATKLFQGKIKKGMEEKLKESLEEKIKASVFPID